MPDHETPEFRPSSQRTSSTPWIIAAVLACAVAVGAAWWFWLRAVEAPLAPPPVAAAPQAPVVSPPMPEASGPQNPVDALAAADTALPALAESDKRVAELLAQLLGRDKVASFLLTDGFVRRVVATVDNLGRAQAPRACGRCSPCRSALWWTARAMHPPRLPPPMPPATPVF